MNKSGAAQALPHSDSEGFTLLELLVAITVFSLLALLMLGGLRLGTRAWEQGQAAGESDESVWAAQSLLRSLLSGIYPQWQTDAPGQGHVMLEGGPQHLTFIASPPAQFGPGRNLNFDLMLSNDDLSLSWASSSGGVPDRSSSVLLHHLDGFKLSYYGKDPNGAGLVWSDRWLNRSSPPKLIRIEVEFAPKDRRYWPELLAHPEIAADVSCVYDAVARGCRGRPE